MIEVEPFNIDLTSTKLGPFGISHNEQLAHLISLVLLFSAIYFTDNVY